MSEAARTWATQQVEMRRRVLAQLQLQAAALEAVGALRLAGIRSILLKGPSIAQWLYDESWTRSYGDIDLLVAPEQCSAASETLARLGYIDSHIVPADDKGPGHAHNWVRTGASPAQIDLHQRLFWVRDGARAAWDELSMGTEQLDLGPGSVETLGPAARLMVVVLHAAQHGRRVQRPMRDLELALQRLDEADWRQAAALAARLDLGEAFAAGLRLLPPGAALAGRLGLMVGTSVEVHLRTASATPAIRLASLLEPRSWRSRALWARREMAPSAEFMRVWKPLARRGPMGLAAAYAWRPLWLGWRLPWAIRDLRRARRQARAAAPTDGGSVT